MKQRMVTGAAPVVAGLAVIAVVFGLLNEHYLAAENLTNLMLQLAATGTISLGVILVLLLGEIDLSAGSVSGLAAVVMTVLSVRHHLPVAAAIGLALLTGAAIGTLHGLLFTRLGMPSFVVTLAGLIGWQGLLLYLLGSGGTINLPFTGFVAKLSDTWLPQWASWLIAAGIVLVWGASALWRRRLRAAAALPVPALWRVLVPIGTAGAVLAAAVVVLSADRGVPLLLLIFGGLVVLLDLALRHTVLGRRIFAVGGNAEAARRAGINVDGVRVLAFAGCGTLAALGGILAASRLSAVNQSSGGSDILLMAIAAAVIGGASLFGGRGRTYAALLGILVIQSITNGMLLLNVDSSIRYMVTAGVLAVAVAVDSLARKGSPGR
ncbi:ABC transporter permease [Catellatospora sp. TT07R-123]|uniref:ABC transporter permease subunit n=1 Tax=Catellatospora sp. TT07R-123 TaxID=2733863 RepID=UPI001B0FE7C9|nr:sugar ABC transporter permease [Catellatospora sp. TT07R-123]GHJ44173.1 ABC transporter permease [Catellatospora sp. TT07R-123]